MPVMESFVALLLFNLGQIIVVVKYLPGDYDQFS